MATLTIKQEGFAQDIALAKHEYFWQAYEANYNCDKMKKDSIYAETFKLMQNPLIAHRIKELKDENTKALRVDLKEVLEYMAVWLRADPINLFDDDGNVLPLSKMSKSTRLCISDIEVKETISNGVCTGVIKKIKTRDLVKVADMHLRAFGAFTKDNLTPDEESNPELIKMLKDNGLWDDKK